MNKKYNMNIENRFEVKPTAPLYKQATGVDKIGKEEDFKKTENIVLRPKEVKKIVEPKMPKESLKKPIRCGLLLTDKQLNDLGILHIKKKVTIAKMLREALEEYLVNRKDEPVEKEVFENTSLRIVSIEKSLLKDLKILSIESGISVSDIGRKAVKLYLTKKNCKL